MIRNVGTLDRLGRVVIGLAVLTLVPFGPHTWWGLLGLVPLTTGVVGYCPMYAPLGWSTKSSNQA